MSDGNLSPHVRSRLLTMRIILASLVMGCLLFSGIAIVLREQQGGAVPQQPMLSFIGLALAGWTGLKSRTNAGQFGKLKRRAGELDIAVQLEGWRRHVWYC